MGVLGCSGVRVFVCSGAVVRAGSSVPVCQCATVMTGGMCPPSPNRFILGNETSSVFLCTLGLVDRCAVHCYQPRSDGRVHPYHCTTMLRRPLAVQNMQPATACVQRKEPVVGGWLGIDVSLHVRVWLENERRGVVERHVRKDNVIAVCTHYLTHPQVRCCSVVEQGGRRLFQPRVLAIFVCPPLPNRCNRLRVELHCWDAVQFDSSATVSNFGDGNRARCSCTCIYVALTRVRHLLLLVDCIPFRLYPVDPHKQT